MKSISLDRLAELGPIDSVGILSFTPSLYALRLQVGGEPIRVLESGASVTRSSAEKIKQLCLGLEVAQYRLVHSSAYDEMIGQPVGGTNRLELNTAAPSEY